MSLSDVKMAGPDSWIDRSMLVFSAPPHSTSSGIAPNIVVVTEKLQQPALSDPAGFIANYGRSHLATLEKSFVDFSQHGEFERVVATRSAFEVRVSWDNQGIRIAQLVVFILKNKSEVVIFTASASADEYYQHAQHFEHAIASLRFTNA